MRSWPGQTRNMMRSMIELDLVILVHSNHVTSNQISELFCHFHFVLE